jgi:hypothetical protein
VKWHDAIAVMGLVAMVGLAPMRAEAAGPIDVQVLVCHAAPAAGGVDAACRELDAKIGAQFRYESLKKLQTRVLELALNEVGSVRLPNGKSLKVRPLQVDDGGVLLAVDVEGAVRTDVKVANGNLVVIGADAYKDGKLVISLEPRW